MSTQNGALLQLYNGGCGVQERTHIEAFKTSTGLGIDKQPRVISNKMFTKKLKNEAVALIYNDVVAIRCYTNVTLIAS